MYVKYNSVIFVFLGAQNFGGKLNFFFFIILIFRLREAMISSNVMRVGNDTFTDPIFQKGLQN
jgi:hypothetical protein